MDNEWPITFDHCECSHCSGASGPCAVCELLAELRWCDAERRLALRALAEYAPTCCVCDARAVVTVDFDGDGPSEFRCGRHLLHHKPGDPLHYAAQIAAADEEIGR